MCLFLLLNNYRVRNIPYQKIISFSRIQFRFDPKTIDKNPNDVDYNYGLKLVHGVNCKSRRVVPKEFDVPSTWRISSGDKLHDHLENGFFLRAAQGVLG